MSNVFLELARHLSYGSYEGYRSVLDTDNNIFRLALDSKTHKRQYGSFKLGRSWSLLDQGNIVSLQQNSTNILLEMGLNNSMKYQYSYFRTHLDVDFVDIIQDEVHVFIKSDNDSFKSHIDNVIQPDLKFQVC